MSVTIMVPLYISDHFGDRQPKYASREQGDLAPIAVIPVFGSPLYPHVWGALSVQERNGPVGKYGV